MPLVVNAFLSLVQAAPAGGEANLILPDLSSVTMLGLDGRTLLMLGLIVCAAGLGFGLWVYRGLRDLPGVGLMRQASWALSAWWMYTVRISQGEYGMDSRALLSMLESAGIQTRPLWQPNHLSRAHSGSRNVGGDVAEQLYREALSLPCSVGLTEPVRSGPSFTALLFAVQLGQADAVRTLLDAGADINDTFPNGTSALVVAAMNGQWELGVFLIDRKPSAAGVAAILAFSHAATLAVRLGRHVIALLRCPSSKGRTLFKYYLRTAPVPRDDDHDRLSVRGCAAVQRNWPR